MMTEEQVRAVAQDFANALDRCEFQSVAEMLAPTCRYDLTGASFTSEETLVGPDDILESYRWHDQRARELFDRVEYKSVVESVDGTTAVIRFHDVIEKNGERHEYSCRQRITVNESSLIDSIAQEDIPAETEAIRAFMERVGVTLDE